MSPTTRNLIEYLALDGPVGPVLAIALGVGLLALFAWALWWERDILGHRTTILFWLLRATALATAIWMLLAPMNVRVETATTRRKVVVMTDVSGSMRTIDPAGTADDVRWAISTATDNDHRATKSADRAIAAIGMAERFLQSAINAVDQHQPESVVEKAATSVNDAIQRTRTHLQVVEDAANRNAAFQPATALIRRLRISLTGPEFEAFEHLCVALQKNRTPSETGWRESLPDLKHRMVAVRHSLQELARQVANIEGRQLAQENAPLLKSLTQKPRVGRAAAVIERLHPLVQERIGEAADVQWAVFDEAPRRVNGERPYETLTAWLTDTRTSSAAKTTDLSAVLNQINRDQQDQPVATVFLLTDAAHNHTDDDNPRDVAATLNKTPVYVVPIGNTQHLRDVILQSVYAPGVAMRNDDIVIEASLQAYECEGEVCTVQLLQEGEIIDFREVVIDSGFASRTVRFERPMPSVGKQQFQVAVPPLKGELADENNYDEFEVNVTRSDIQVLLADEMPRWEYRYLAQLFRRDAKISCDELLFHPRMIATGRRKDSKTVPITVDEWDQYDVVMLGDLPAEHLPVAAQESLEDYLKQRGGTLVVIAGPVAMPQAYVDHPLEDLLPVRPIENSAAVDSSGYVLRTTDAGRNHHALMIGESEEATQNAWDFLNRFVPLHGLSAWRHPRPSAQTLIAAAPKEETGEDAAVPNSAFLCWQSVGRGKVVYLSGPETYRLRFLRGDRLHYRFWGQLLRWAIATDLSAGSKFVRIRTDKTRYNTRESVQMTVRLTDAEGEPVVDADVNVQVTSADAERVISLRADVTIPGEYRAEMTSLSPGVYRVEPIGTLIEELDQGDQQEPASASFTVQADLPQELIDTRCDRALAQQIADITGGQVLPPTAIEEILALTNLEPIVTEQIERRPLWLEWKYLWIVFGCLQIEWVIRKWRGLS